MINSEIGKLEKVIIHFPGFEELYSIPWEKLAETVISRDFHVLKYNIFEIIISERITPESVE